MVVGLEKWTRLGPRLQAQLETACTAGVIRNLARAEALEPPVLARYEARGVTMEILKPEILAALAQASEEVLAEEAANDVDFARVLASQRSFQADYARWRNIAYPRAQ
jgi:TRAP-type mannitol/chloroaromatic compound transport system substrate-binding protein